MEHNPSSIDNFWWIAYFKWSICWRHRFDFKSLVVGEQKRYMIPCQSYQTHSKSFVTVNSGLATVQRDSKTTVFVWRCGTHKSSCFLYSALLKWYQTIFFGNVYVLGNRNSAYMIVGRFPKFFRCLRQLAFQIHGIFTAKSYLFKTKLRNPLVLIHITRGTKY